MYKQQRHVVRPAIKLVRLKFMTEKLSYDADVENKNGGTESDAINESEGGRFLETSVP